MPERPPTADPDDAPDGGSSGGVPRWQIVVGIVGLVVIVLIVGLLLSGGHGPGMHAPSGDAGVIPDDSAAVADR